MATNSIDLDLILQKCLERVLDRQETIASVLESYPEQADELQPMLEAAVWLRSQRKAYDPRPGFVAASRRRLVQRLQTPPVPVKPFWQRIWSGLALQPVLARVLVVGILAAFIFTVAGGALALASQQSLPGEGLYSMKQMGESTRLGLTSSPEQEAQLLVNFAATRLEEVRLILNVRPGLVRPTLDRYQLHLERATLAVEKIAQQDLARSRRVTSDLNMQVMAQSEILNGLALLAGSQFQDQFSSMSSFAATWGERTEELIRSVEPQTNPGEHFSTGTPSVLPSATSESAGASDTPVLTATPTPSPTAFENTITPSPEPNWTATPTSIPILTNPTATNTVAPVAIPTATAVVLPTTPPDDDDVVPTPKPTKTPKPLPSPTRRPPKPTKDK